MIYYWDTSAYVKIYHREKGTGIAENLFKEVADREKKGAISYLGLMETVSAFSRQRELIKGNYEALIARILEDMQEHLSIIPIEYEIMEKSTFLIIKHRLKTLDSLHLATALFLKNHSSEEIVFISSDRELLRAAEKEGLKVINPEE